MRRQRATFSLTSSRGVCAAAVAALLVTVCGLGAAADAHLELLHAWTSFREPMVLKMLDDFMAAYPGITVEARVVPNDQLHEQFMLAYAGGVAPDVVMLSTKHVIALGEQGVLLDLTEFIERDGISWDIWVPSEIGLGQIDGKTYGLPIRTGGEAGNVLYYNKRLFAEAGLDDSRAPATWDELLLYSKKLIRYDGDQIVLNPINDITQGATVQPTLNWLYSGGGRFLSDDLRTIAFNTPEAVRTFNFVQQFRTEVYRNVTDGNMGNADFYNGRSAMFFWGSEGFSYVWDQDPDFPLGAGPRPKHPDSPYIGANSGTWHYAIPATVKDKEAAWELLKWLTIREESAGWFMRMQGRASPIRAYNSHPEYFDVNPLAHVLGQILEQVAPVTILPIHDDIAIPLRDAFRRVLRSEASAGVALAEAAATSQAVLDRYWSERDSAQ